MGAWESWAVDVTLLTAEDGIMIIVPICGINLPNMSCPRSEWNIIMFSGFYLDIEEVAVPAKCLSTIIFITLKVV